MSRERDLIRWPQLQEDASAVPEGKRPKPGVFVGCGQDDCSDCYEDDDATVPGCTDLACTGGCENGFHEPGEEPKE